MKKLSLFFYLFSLFLNHTLAQLPVLDFTNYSASDGLAPSWLPGAIVQDQDGYIWVNSGTGLCRFNGYEFKIYRHDLNDPSSLKENFPQDYFIDYKKRLWVVNYGVNGGLSVYNPDGDNFLHYNKADSAGYEQVLPEIHKVHSFKKGQFWVFTEDSKCYLFDTRKRIFERILNKNKFLTFLSKGYIGQMLNDSNGNYWAAHYPGLIKYNPQSDKLTIFQPEKGNRNSLLNNNINSLYEDSSGVIFIGTKESGLHRYDPDRDAIIQLPEKNGKYKYLQAPQSGGSLYIATGSVFAIQQISDGTFWINSVNGGLKVYNPDLTKSMLYLPDGNKNLALNFITSIFEDNQKNIWLNTLSKGILKVRASKSLFTLAGKGFNELEKLHLNNIRGIYESRDKSLWIGTANGTLVNYNPATNKAKIFKTGSLYGHPGSQLTGSDYEAFYEDKDGFIWIASFNAIIKYNPQNNHFEKVYYKMNGKLSESRIDVEGFVPDNNEDYLWIAGWGFGLIKLNLKTLETQIFKSSADSTGLLSNNIFTISKSRSGDILICTEYGLSIYEQSKNQFKNYPLGSRFNSVYEDSAGILWTGSVEGLFKIDRKKNTVKHFTTTDGLPSNMIAGILGDDKYLWIGTGGGLVRFNVADESILTFNETDGAQLDLFEIANSYYKTRDGLFLFGGTDGITAFNPSKIKMNIYPPNVLITDMKIYDKSENKYFTKRNWDNGKVNTVEFPYFQNEIEFNYVGLHYKRPERNKYKYRLEPYDKIWKDAGTQRIARYTSLDPGDYTFRVMACNSDGIWNPKPAALHIVILPPWWKTWWAYGIYLIIGLGLLYSIRSFELNRRQEKEENKRKSEELEEARQLQLSMLPKELPKLPHLDIAVYMQTATEVGGDYYDFNVSMDGTLTVVIGDATGHGMKAGTMVTSVKLLFNTHAGNNDILFSFNELSRCIRKMNFGRIAMCLTMLKISDHTMQIATAAMPPSYIYRNKTKEVEEYQFEAMPLGAMERFPYQVKETKLNKGDTILLMSDGLPELENKNAAMYGYSRIIDGFQNIAEKSVDDIISHLKNEGDSWADNSDPGDDVTFVVIKVK